MSRPAEAEPRSSAATAPARRARWRTLLGIAVSIAFLWWALSGLDLGDFREALGRARYGWLVPGVLSYFAGLWIRTWRWHYMLRHLHDVPMRRLFRIMCIGYMGNNVYPLRAGEVLRSYVLKRETGVRMSASLATVAIERLFDGLTMLAFVFIALPLVQLESAALVGYRPYIVAFTLIFVVALLIFLGLAPRPHAVRTLAAPMIAASARAGARLSGTVRGEGLDADQLDARLAGTLDRFLLGLDSMARARDVGLIFMTSVGVWLAETGKYWFVMHAFDFEVSFFTLMLMNGLVNLATMIPAAPGHFGPFDAVGIQVLVTAGVARASAAAYTLVLHGALWFPVTALGAWYLWRSHLSLRQAREALSEDAAADGRHAMNPPEESGAGAAAGGAGATTAEYGAGVSSATGEPADPSGAGPETPRSSS